MNLCAWIFCLLNFSAMNPAQTNMETEKNAEIATLSFTDRELRETQAAADFIIRAFPNPFRTETTFSYTLKADDEVKMEIFTTMGQRIKTLVNATQFAGEHHIRWTGVDEFGNKISAGCYIYRFSSKTIKPLSGRIILTD